MQLVKPPETLCVHINRVTYSPLGMEILNSAPVKIPRHFTLSEILPARELGDSNNTDTRYALGAMIEHIGLTPHSGHYMAYKRLFPESLKSRSEKAQYRGKWLQANDEVIKIVDEKQVLGRKRSAYLLFYERVSDEPRH